MSRQRTVLIGSAGTGTGFAAVCALRRVWSQSVRVIAMDIHPRHLVTTSLLADGFHQVPLSAAPAFPAVVLDLLQRHQVDAYLPLLPEEIVLAARMREQGLIANSVVVLAASQEASALCADKWALSQFLPEHGVPVPKTATAAEPFAAEAYFLKLRRGTGSHDARKLQAAELAAALGARAEDWVVQEICSPPEVTVDAFFDPMSGFSHAVCRERVEIKSGVSTKCRLFQDDGLSGRACDLAASLQLAGSFCFQVMRNATGWVVTDVNPRPGAATAMCAATGNDFFAASFARCWGEDVRRFFRPLAGEEFVTRQYAEFVMGPRT